MTLLALLEAALRLAGRPWTIWIVGIGLTIVNRSEGAGGFDAVVLAVGPTIVWGVFSYGCRLLTGGSARWRRSIVPTNKPLPKAQLAVLVVPPCSSEACPDIARMVERLPENLRRLVTPAAG